MSCFILMDSREQRDYAGSCWALQQDLGSKPEPLWSIRLPSLFPSVGLRGAGQPTPAQSYLVPIGPSSLKDGVTCLRLLL